jgi:class 3 adenylate cyclase/tetratricopeptide (TPR) repeat protein
MKCPQCQHENEAGAKFCEECAAPLARACATCGRPLSPTAKFCPECAHPTGLSAAPPPAQRFDSPESYTPKHLAEKILTSKTALEGERKQVTVLFADLKGSMELLADRDPEEARKLLDPVLERMMEAVHRYEGTVNQVMGDGIMALFGAPLAHEDHAVRACYAALDMQGAIRRYADEVRRTLGIRTEIRIGLNSGEVVVRAIGSDLRMDYTAVGQTTHLAARMEQLASAGTTLLTGDTLRLAEGFVAVKPVGPVPVKGLDKPVETYEMLGAGPLRSRLHATAARGLTRFVGREPELEQLRQALGRAAAGHGQLVAIVGEPGVGKSRLVWEMTHSHRTHGWLTVQASSVSYGKATPYRPVIDLLKGYLTIQDQDDQRAVREKVTGKLLTLDEALKPSVPAFLALLDAPVDDAAWQGLDPPQRRQRTMEAVKRLLLRETQVQPLLVVFEDLHWIDSETQAVLDSLVDSLPTARMLLLVNYRPEYAHRWGSKTYYTQIRLDPLPPESADALLDALAGSDPALRPLKHLLIARTEGNPFFLEESVRTLVETKVLAGERGAYRLVTALPSIQVPATVQAVLAARIDRLPAEEKRLLQCAAVVGKDVPVVLLQSIADLSSDAFERGLAHLQAAEFLYETGLGHELEYTFKHALTHEVAYGSLLQDRRRALHARILGALETSAGGGPAEQIDRLAHHAMRGEVWDRAVAYLHQTVARATARSAHREAVAGVEQALTALEHLPESREKLERAIDLRFQLRIALWPLGAMGRILDVLREAETLAETLGDRRRMGLASAYLCTSYYSAAQHDQAVAAGERARAHSLFADALDLRVLASSHLGQAHVARTDYRQATEVLEETVAQLPGEFLRERFGQATVPSVLARINLVRSLVERGRFHEAIDRAEEAIRIAEAVSHPASLLLAHWVSGLASLRRGDVAHAIPSLERSVRICREVDLPIFLHWVGPSLGAAYATTGRMTEALTLLGQILEQDASMNVMSQNTLTVVYLAEAHLLAGHVQEATNHAACAIALSRRRNERGYQAWALRLVGEIGSRHEVGDLDGGAASYQEALKLSEELDMRPLEAHCHLGLGRLRWRGGDRAASREHLGRAAAMYGEMDMKPWLDQVESELARVD